MMKTSNLFKADISGFIELRDLPDCVTGNIQEQVTRLCQEYRYISNCQVSVQAPAFHPEGCYQIQIVLTLPDRVLTIDRAPNLDCFQEDIYVAIWSAFNSAKKRLQESSIVVSYGVNKSPNPGGSMSSIRPIRRTVGYAGA